MENVKQMIHKSVKNEPNNYKSKRSNKNGEIVLKGTVVS